jgi:hypothetical protein
MLTFLLSNANLFRNPVSFSSLELNLLSRFEEFEKAKSEKVSNR